MKRICFFTLAGLLLTAAFSCDKQPEQPGDPEVATVAGVPLTIKVTIGGPDTKLGFTKDGNVLKGAWNANEKVSVLTVNDGGVQTIDTFSTGEESEGTTSADFTGMFTGDAASSVYVFYPALEEYGTGVWGTPKPAGGVSDTDRMISGITINDPDCQYCLNMKMSTQTSNDNTDHLGAFTFMTGIGDISEGALSVTLDPKISVLQVNITFKASVIGKTFGRLIALFRKDDSSDYFAFGDAYCDLEETVNNSFINGNVNYLEQRYGSYVDGSFSPLTLGDEDNDFVAYIPFAPGSKARIGGEGATSIEFVSYSDNEKFSKVVGLTANSALQKGKIYRVRVTLGKEIQTLSFANDSEETVMGSDYTIQTVTGALTDVEYTSSNSDVATISGTTITLVGPGVTTITATAVEDDAYSSATASYTLTVNPASLFNNIVELKALLGEETGTFDGKLTDAVVSFIAGTSDAVIKDATGSILYHKEDGHGLLQGQTISGNVTVDGLIYNGNYTAITSLTATVEGDECAVAPEIVTLEEIYENYETYEDAYVKVVGVTSRTTTTKKGEIDVVQNSFPFIVYTNVSIPLRDGDVFTAEGTVTKSGSTKELKVWKKSDLTITEPAPFLSASPTETSVPGKTTSVSWAITSNTSWTITPGPGVTASMTSGSGNADITLSFAANEGSGVKTYTATASATGCDDVTITITQQAANSSSGTTDVITSSKLSATSTTYTDFSNVAVGPKARYAGNSAKSSSGGVMLRTKNANSGIVSTTSGGKVKSVKIVVESGSNTIDVYGKNTAYGSAGDLYSANTQGTKIGSLSASGTIDFTTLEDQYTYIGIRSNNGAVYITRIEIVWE